MLAQIKKRPKRAADKRRLTELSVRKAKPRTATYLVWDTHQRGLALQIQPTGAKAWKVIYSRHGRPRWLHLGHANSGGVPLAEARVMAQEYMLAVAKGRDPVAEKRGAERGAGTFAELAAKYVEQHAKKRNRSWRQADALVRRFAIPRWGKLQASAITRGDIKQLMAKIDKPILANQVLAAVSAIFSWGLKEEIVTANPCKLVERNPVKSRERVLTGSELSLFWKAFGDLDPVRGPALKAILLLGQRPGEIAHMRVEHIRDNWWEMPGAPIADAWPGTKNKQDHRVWLPKAVQQLIGSDKPPGFVFAGPRGAPVTHLDDAMRDICRQLGVERATPHDLRRTHGSTITALGFGRDAMNRIQNHKEGGIADVYDRHRYEDENRRVMEAVARRVMALVEGREGNVLSSSDPRVKHEQRARRLYLLGWGQSYVRPRPTKEQVNAVVQWLVAEVERTGYVEHEAAALEWRSSHVGRARCNGFNDRLIGRDCRDHLRQA
jgi:integrase